MAIPEEDDNDSDNGEAEEEHASLELFEEEGRV